MSYFRFYSLLGFLLGYTCVIAQNKIRCKETGFHEKPLKICFSPCVKTILEEQCSDDLKGFSGSLECKLVISIPNERILNTQLLIFDKNSPLSPKQRLSIKKALQSISLTFIGKKQNKRQASPSYLYKTSWVYSIQDGHFEAL